MNAPYASLAGVRILVVGHESPIAEEIRDRLERMKYQVVGIADTAAWAIERATDTKPDLILMDIRLKGGMNGFEAADHIYRRLGIPSVFVTAHSDPDTIQRAMRSGQFGYVVKPFEEGALQAAIEMGLQRHRADRDLSAAQMWQAAMSQCANDAIVGIDPDGIVLSWNRAAENLFGYRAIEAIGRHIDFLAPDKDKEEVSRTLERTRRGEAFELPAIERCRKDGSLVEVWIKVAPVREPLGKIIGAVGVLRDVSELKQSERKLWESQAHLLASQAIANVGSWELAVTGRKELDSASFRCSEEWFRVFGYEPCAGGIAGAVFLERVHPGDRDRVEMAFRQALESLAVFEIDHRIVLPDGSERYIRQLAEVIPDPEAGQPLKLIGTSQDITERRKAGDKLRESEKRLRTIVECMPVMLVAFDENGVPVAWNLECERVTGYLASEIIGNRRAAEILYPNPAERARMLESFHIRGGDARGQVWSLSCKDGTVRTIEWSGISDRLPIPGWAAWMVGVDMTERLRLEEELRQSQKMESLSALVGGMAHDFNNLLTVINGRADLLLRKLKEADPVRGALAQMRDAGEKAAGLVRQLMTFSRKQIVTPVLLDLNFRVHENLAMLASLLGENIELITKPASSPVLVMADPLQIDQILINLAGNARDAMPRGGRLVIETAHAKLDATFAAWHPEIAPGPFILLSVSDTGIGIRPDIRERIFDPFFTTKELGGGTGLGLAAVYGILRQCGGTISASSGPDQGTTFRIYLPRADGLAGASANLADCNGAQRGAETMP